MDFKGYALASYHGFNLDVEEPVVFQEDAASFGQSVVQFGRSRLVVGAPPEVLAVNHTGRLYDCATPTGQCQPISLNIPPEAVNMSLDLSLAASTNHSQLLACGPTMHRACGENMYVRGSCILLGAHLQIIRTVPAALPECPNQEMDIAFLIDGSGSIDRSGFNQMKDFVRTVMGQFEGTNTLFSLMQYSNLLKVHFTFTVFQTSLSPQSLVDPIVQLKGLTFTATGILKVVTELFHSNNGARENAKKILIVITDGQKYKDPLEYSDVIPRAESAGIIRYAIGVGDAFKKPTAKQELSTIGSVPPQDHVFEVDNFAALGSIQKQLQEKIFAVEGTLSRTSSSFQNEMSQEGFSSVLPMDGPVLGAVGSFSWSGGAFLYPSNMSPTFINVSQEYVDMRDSYLGYATELALWKGVPSLVLGAPRHQHAGKVVIFTQVSRQWRPKAEVTGSQIGSYFGASLCSIDMDRDGSTDLVLIGAPHYYEQTRGGQVSVCPMPRGQSRWRCEVILRGEQGHPWGRFGAALTVLGDVNGDKLTDVAIGAPGEEENRGAVCVFHGASGLDINPSPSQTQPPRTATSVFSMCIPSTWYRDVQSSVSYDLALDPGHLLSRAIFDETKNWTLTRRKTLGLGDHCETVKLLWPDCVEDVVSPIFLRLNFSMVGVPIPSSQNLRPVLAVGSQALFTATLPFEKNCGQDRLCEGDLSVSLSFSGLQTLIVGSSLELNVTVTVWNEGEDSYGTVINFYYPAGLSYRWVSETLKQPHQRPLCLACEAVLTKDEGLRSSSCSMNHLIFREVINSIFIVTFAVSYKATLGERLLIRANASSENNKPATSKTTFQLELPVKYAVYTVISRQEESTKYFNFSTSDKKSRKEAEHRYRVNNLSQRDLAISINFWVPILLNGMAVWDVAVQTPSQSLPCVSEREPPQQSDSLTQIQRTPVLDCSVAECLRFRCDIPSFGIQEELDFILQGNLSFGWVSQTQQKKVLVVSEAEITFDTSMYFQLPGQEVFMRAQMETVLEEYEVHDLVPPVVGSSMGGLLLLALIAVTLYKLGFFIRRYKEMLNDKREDTTTFSGEDISCEAPNIPLS
ncbi:integrin alpha-D-like [Cynocephalus volans]|uniref:integrin alpha-D-like n=1 Tax=Cynocephalus volans TaxID=110931 RepID=UPI002FC965F8